MLFLVICILLLCLAAVQPVINHLLLPRLLFSPPPVYEIPQNFRVDNNNIWLQFNCPQPTKTALVLFHGNACDIFSYEQMGATLSQQLNCDVFIPEYPQYSIMKAKFPHLSTKDCLPTLVQFMQNQVSANNYYEQVILVGQSLGSHFAIHMAALQLGTALCLISPFYSIQQVAKSWVGNFLSSFITTFDSGVPLQKINPHMPLLIFHGTHDQIIPFENAELIMQKCPSQYKQLVTLQGYGHNDLDMDHIWDAVRTGMSLK